MKRITILIILLALSLFACSGQENNGGLPVSPTNSQSQNQVEITESPSIEPSLTRIVLFLTQPGAEAYLYNQVVSSVSQVAVENGLVFREQYEALPMGENEVVDLVVVIPPYADVFGILIAYPGARIVAIGFEGLNPQAGMTLVSLPTAEEQGFVAGYLAALMTEDYRIGMLSHSDAVGQAYQEGFLTGAIYSCGLCLPAFPPYYTYPTYNLMEAGLDFSGIQPVVDDLLSRSVTTVYLPPELDNPSLADYLAQSNRLIIGGGQPSAGSESHWIASIGYQLSEILPDLLQQILNGNEFPQIALRVELTYVNSELLSEGRQSHLEEIIDQLHSGVMEPIGE